MEDLIHPVKSAKGGVLQEAKQFDRVNEILNRGVEEVIERESLSKKLNSGKRLRVKFGIDPTSPYLHLGHTVPLRKLRQFQDLGHTAVLVIGDFTARIGDPTGRSEERKTLTPEQVKENMKEYLRQAAKVLDINFSIFGKAKHTSRFEARYNESWFGREGLEPVMKTARSATINQVIQRADFKKRLDEGGSVSVLESLYPIMQGYDSVEVKADVEIGGSDQKFNLLMGRQVQKHFDMDEQDILTLPLLEGTDGVKKMSKSFGNYIALDEKPSDMFGKVMSIPDNLIIKYCELLTDLNIEDVKSISNPKDQKAMLAKEIVRMYHGEKEAQKSEEEFNQTFKQGELPSEIKVFKTDKKTYPILDLLFDSELAESKNDAKRVVGGGGVTAHHGTSWEIKDWKKEVVIEDGMVIQFGKRKFIKIKLK